MMKRKVFLRFQVLYLFSVMHKSILESTVKPSHAMAHVLCTWKPDNFYATNTSFSYLMYLCHSYVNQVLNTCINITGNTNSYSFKYVFSNQYMYKNASS